MSGIKSYYNYASVLSHNATFNGICGARGLGKTWGGKKKVIGDALKSIKFQSRKVDVERRGKPVTLTVIEAEKPPTQFVYLRRYKEELELAKATFFADIEHKWPAWDFRVTKWEAQASPRKYAEMKNRPWVTIGFFIALSVARNYKSVQFPNVNWIIFDEFIIEKGGQYLPEEALKFVNFYNTVDRYNDRTRVLMLANAVTITNPYFIQYRVEPQKADDKGFIRMASGYMIWHFPESKQFESEVFQTAFGKFIAETDPDYADYAVSNSFGDNHTSMVDKKPSSAFYLFTLETRNGTFSIWYNLKNDTYYCQEKRPPRDNEDYVTIVETWMSEGKRLLNFTDKTMGRLRTAFRHDRVRFSAPHIRNAFMEIFKR